MKTAKRPGVKAPGQESVRLSTRISPESYQRLFLTSIMNKQTAGEILDRLIKSELREYRIQRNPTIRDGSHDRVPGAPEIDISGVAEAA